MTTRPAPVDHPGPEFEQLLAYLKRARGFDFGGYKRASLARRVNKRMATVGCETYAAYVDYLEVHPDEFAALFDTILINVTRFFRDPDLWAHLQAEVIPALVARKEDQTPIRVWSAGCATGEEAYSLAIAFAEVLGVEKFRERVKIYATDLDEHALATARAASFGAAAFEGLPEPLIEKYFDRAGASYVFRNDLRRFVIFGRHDLMQDAPISRVDLLACRNVLMYFNAEAQQRILTRFHFALGTGGVLLLGRAETLLSRTSHFVPLDLKRRIFEKLPHPRHREPSLPPGRIIEESDELSGAPPSRQRLRESVLDMSPVALVALDGEGVLAVANDRARTIFNLAPTDIGRPLQDLELSYRPLELRSRIDEVYVQGHPVVVSGVEWPTMNGDLRSYDVRVAALNGGANAVGVCITFTDTTVFTQLQRELERSNQELEAAYEELQSTNEELETTNEELQSTVEELETTNEELQSTNEELETMNEELQSANEELQTINEEVRRRSDELNDVNAFLESVLTSLRAGVVVVDGDLRVSVWNRQAEELWGLRADEVTGRSILALDIGLPVRELAAPLHQVLEDGAEFARLALDATNRRGRAILCQVTCTPLRDTDRAPRGAILLMESEPA